MPFDSSLLDAFSPVLARQLLNAVATVEKNTAKRSLVSGKRQKAPFTAELTVQRLTSTSGALRGVLLLLGECSNVAPAKPGKGEKTKQAPSTDDKTVVTAGIAHQLRNNLQSVQSIVELVSMGTSGAFVPDDYIAMLRQELSEADYMLTEMLNLARWQELDLKELDINAFCKDIVKLVQANVILQPVKIVERYGKNLPLFRLDMFRLKQVLLNLMRNALDALDGKGTIIISTSCDPKTKWGKIDIEDTGGGMDEETLEKIRQPFYTTKEKGTGLGLLVCRRLLADQGAYLDIASKKGKGSTFSIMLPMV